MRTRTRCCSTCSACIPSSVEFHPLNAESVEHKVPPARRSSASTLRPALLDQLSPRRTRRAARRLGYAGERGAGHPDEALHARQRPLDGPRGRRPTAVGDRADPGLRQAAATTSSGWSTPRATNLEAVQRRGRVRRGRTRRRRCSTCCCATRCSSASARPRCGLKRPAGRSRTLGGAAPRAAIRARRRPTRPAARAATPRCSPTKRSTASGLARRLHARGILAHARGHQLPEQSTPSTGSRRSPTAGSSGCSPSTSTPRATASTPGSTGCWAGHWVSSRPSDRTPRVACPAEGQRQSDGLPRCLRLARGPAARGQGAHARSRSRRTSRTTSTSSRHRPAA